MLKKKKRKSHFQTEIQLKLVITAAASLTAVKQSVMSDGCIKLSLQKSICWQITFSNTFFFCFCFYYFFFQTSISFVEINAQEGCITFSLHIVVTP